MRGFERVFVDYHQFQVSTGHDIGDLPLYTAGDGLVHLSGESTLTVMAGPHTGRVAVRASILPGPPEDDGPQEWDAVSEASLWSPDGWMSVRGLMGDCPDALREMRFPAPSLVRVRVRARERQAKSELFEVAAWPVTEESGLSTVSTDGMPASEWPPEAAAAASWAMVRLVTVAKPARREARLRAASGRAPTDAPRVDVRRVRELPATEAYALVRRPAERLGLTADLVLPAGEVHARLHAARATGDAFTAQWRWAALPGSSTVVPDAAASAVEIRVRPAAAGDTAEVTLVHRGVRARDAVLLGLVWDYLLAGPDAGGHPWEPVFAEMAAKAAATRRRHEESEARRWGGRLPSERIRTLGANVWGMAKLDRDLLDALDAATAEQQREVARWAAHRACEVAGLAGIGWVAGALAALDRGAPLPPPFDDDTRAWDLLFTDPQVPSTTVTSPDRRLDNFSQQAAALPAISAATRDDPLAAAVDALHAAAYAYGIGCPELFAAARAAYPFLNRTVTP